MILRELYLRIPAGQTEKRDGSGGKNGRFRAFRLVTTRSTGGRNSAWRGDFRQGKGPGDYPSPCRWWWWSSPLEETFLPHGHCHRRRDSTLGAHPRENRTPTRISSPPKATNGLRIDSQSDTEFNICPIPVTVGLRHATPRRQGSPAASREYVASGTGEGVRHSHAPLLCVGFAEIAGHVLANAAGSVTERVREGCPPIWTRMSIT